MSASFDDVFAQFVDFEGGFVDPSSPSSSTTKPVENNDLAAALQLDDMAGHVGLWGGYSDFEWDSATFGQNAVADTKSAPISALAAFDALVASSASSASAPSPPSPLSSPIRQNVPMVECPGVESLADVGFDHLRLAFDGHPAAPASSLLPATTPQLLPGQIPSSSDQEEDDQLLWSSLTTYLGQDGQSAPGVELVSAPINYAGYVAQAPAGSHYAGQPADGLLPSAQLATTLSESWPAGGMMPADASYDNAVQPSAPPAPATPAPRGTKRPAAASFDKVPCGHIGCSYASDNKEELRRHRSNVHEGTKLAYCQLCEKALNDPSSKSKHERSTKHNDKLEAAGRPRQDRNYACRWCVTAGAEKSAFARADHLARHLKACKRTGLPKGSLPPGYTEGAGGMALGRLRPGSLTEFIESG